jgi:dTDP-4-amino-4,6-dideoxygalactose transaminase
VIVPAQTFVATFEAVTQAGGRPVVVDVDERDYCISVDAVEAALTSRTAAVLPVHLYGQMADVSRLSAFVSQRGLVLLEDAAQAHGATRDGVKAGTAGHVGAFSFYPGKNLGALGDAGALITPDAELASAARALREHGQHVKYQSSVEGYTARLDTIQAIALAAKLEHLDRWTARRRELASLYDKALAGLGDLRLPPVPPASEPVWHLYVVRTADPDRLARALSELGIGSGRHYPIAPHRTDAYAHLGYGPGAFPVAEAISREGLSLPIYPGLSDSQLERVVEGIRGFFGG